MMIRGNFGDFFFETQLPAIHGSIWDRYKKARRVVPMLFSMETSDRSIEQMSQVSGLGLFSEIPETGEVRMDQPVQGFDSLFKHKRFGMGVEFSRDLFEDDRFGIVKRSSGELANSSIETQEIDGAGTFNNGFTGGAFVGPDGVALFSASHPMVKAGGVQSNILSVAADLDVTSLELALTDWGTMKRSNGHDISLPAPNLLIHPSNQWNAIEILKSQMRSDTANNTTNAFKHADGGEAIAKTIIWRKLTDTDAWFLVAPPSDNCLVWFWRVKPYTKGFADDRTERGGTAMRYKKSHGWYDYIGVYGTAGGA